MKQRCRLNYSKDKKTGMTRTFAEAAAGGADKLTLALERGEVTRTTADGCEFFIWRTLEAGSSDGFKTDWSLQGEAALTAAQAAELDHVLRAVRWDFQITPMQEKKAVVDGILPAKVLGKMDEAESTLQLLVKEGSKVLEKLSQAGQGSGSDTGKAMRQELAGLLAKSTDNLADIAKIKVLKTGPKGEPPTTHYLQGFLASVAQAVFADICRQIPALEHVLCAMQCVLGSMMCVVFTTYL